MSPTSCRCSTPRRDGERKPPLRDEAGSARGGRVSHGVGAAVPAGADAFHDRVRDGTGWARIALGHGQASPPQRCCSFAGNVAQCRVVSPMMMIHQWVDSCPPERATRHAAGIGVPSTMSTARLRRSPAFHRPPRHRVVCAGSYRLEVVGGVILRRVSHLDALSGSPCWTRLPGGACRHTTGPPAVHPARSSRTSAGPSHTPVAHSG